MAQSFDSRLGRVLASLGIGSDALLGEGGESRVYALDQERVARIGRPGTSRAQVESRAALLAELDRSRDRVPFAIPEVSDIVEVADYTISIERRLPGRPLLHFLAHTGGQARTMLIRAYLEAAAQIGNLAIQRPWYGDLLAPEPIRSHSYPDYLQRRVARSLEAAGLPLQHYPPASLAIALPQSNGQSLVHLDAFPGNMLSDGQGITAVLDFGASCLIGDRRLDPLASAAYLASAITPSANHDDRATAGEWLVEHELTRYFAPAQQWLAAYWSFATDDHNLHRWCRQILDGWDQQQRIGPLAHG